MPLILNTSPIFPPIRYWDETQNEIRLEYQAQIINFNIHY